MILRCRGDRERLAFAFRAVPFQGRRFGQRVLETNAPKSTWTFNFRGVL